MEDVGSLVVISVADSLTSELRRQILSQQLGAGERVAEAAVAQRYAVSRPSARVAVERLIGEGLLERTAHHAAKVITFGPDVVADMYLSRSMIETGVYRRLAEDRCDLGDAEAEIDRLHDAALRGDVVELVDADVHFHRLLVNLLGSPSLSAIHGQLIVRMQLCLAQVQNNHLLDPCIIEEEHRGILAAIREKNPDEAESRGRRHLERARDQLVAHHSATH